MPVSIPFTGQPLRRYITFSGSKKTLSGLRLAGSRGLAMVAQVLVQMAVGALSGPVGIGVLQLFSTWSNFLGETLARGWPPVVLKRVAVAWGEGDKPSARAVVGGANRSALRGWPLGLAIAVIFVVAGQFVSIRTTAVEGALLVLALLVSAITFARLRVRSEALKGMDAPVTAITLENLALPSVLLALCLACALFQFTPGPALLVLGCVLGVLVASAWLGRAVNARLGNMINETPTAESPTERRERRALWLSSAQAIAFLQLPFLVLPAFTDIGTIGVYSVAHKLINVITTLLILLGSIYGPAFARAAAKSDTGELRILLRRTQLISIGVFGPAAAILLLTSNSIAGLFNVPSKGLQGFMLILVLGQSINAATGLSGILLNMSGAARTEWRISLLSLCTALLLTMPVGGTYGATGLAILFSAVIAAKNIASWLAARHHLVSGVVTK
jgi:O-antigen/teichoic acid export membrane protein